MPAEPEPPPLLPTGQPPMYPPAYPDAAVVQRIKDGEHLRLLSIFHYILGGLAILLSCFFILYGVFGFMMLSAFAGMGAPNSSTPHNAFGSPIPAASPREPSATPEVTTASPRPSPIRTMSHGPNPPAFFGYFMIGFATFALVIGWTVGALLIYSGRNLARHTGRTLSMVVAGLSCLQVPFGTLLGVFTLVVLSRPSVLALYASRARG